MMKKIRSLMRTSLFWRIYFITVCVFVCLLIAGMIFFSVWLSDYEGSQNTVAADEVIAMFRNGEYADIVSHTDVVQAGLADASSYEEKLRQAAQDKSFTYVKTFSYDRFESPSYIIKADGNDLCKLVLKKSDKTSRFGFSLYEFDYLSDFSFADVKIVLLAPEGSTPSLDGIEVPDAFKKTLAKDQLSDAYTLGAVTEINRYEISGLLSEPENVEIACRNGEKLKLKVNSDNEIEAETVNITVNAPVGFTVKINGVTLGDKYITNASSDNPNVKYMINDDDRDALSLFHTYRVEGFFEMPTVEVYDENGDPIECTFNSETYVYDVGVRLYTLRVPSDYSVSVNGTDISSSDRWKVSGEKTDELKNMPAGYFTEPEMITYKAALLSGMPEVTVKNYAGERTDVQYDEGSMTFICDFAPSESVKEEYSQIAVDGAKAYAAFMTNDISMSSFLSRIIEGTRMYSDMSEYRQYFYTDHNSTSFENTEVYDMRTYTDNCFSCGVYFDYWIYGQRGKPDFQAKLETNTRIWYIKTDSGWKMADIEISDRR